MKVKIYIILIIISCYQLHLQAQVKSIYGLWQADEKEVTSMYFDTYEFSNDNNFTFRPNGYNGLNRIVGIMGVYKIISDTIYLFPKYTLELKGGYPIRSTITTLADTWEIYDAKVKKVQCKMTTQKATFGYCQEEKCIQIDKRKYYYIKEISR